MNLYNMFSTPFWVAEVEFDNERLLQEIYKFSMEVPNQDRSNSGGYQGHGFKDPEWVKLINSAVPELEQNPIKKMGMAAWVNINQYGHFNHRHTHFNSDIFLSGIYYVKVPENSGGVRFWDPRGPLISTSMDHKYFNHGYTFHELQPDPGTLCFFPSWLEHDVLPNMNPQREDRISIAFNIMVSETEVPLQDPQGVPDGKSGTEDTSQEE